jgi:hypothetical protein
VVTSDFELDWVAQGGSTEHFDFLSIGQAHLQQTDGNTVFAFDVDDASTLPWLQSIESEHVVPALAEQERLARISRALE